MKIILGKEEEEKKKWEEDENESLSKSSIISAIIRPPRGRTINSCHVSFRRVKFTMSCAEGGLTTPRISNVVACNNSK